MNSKSRNRAACGVESPPVEIGLSVDDRPNKLYIAFWVISSVGAASPLLLHIIYVSVHATSLSSPLFSCFYFIPSPHTNTSLYPSLALFRILFFPFSAFPSFFTFYLSCLPFCPLVSLFPLTSLYLQNFLCLSLCISLLPLSFSSSPLLFSLSLPPFVSFPPSLSSSLFFFCLTL